MTSLVLRGCVITTACVDDDTKSNIRRIVETFGGVFLSKLKQNITHLIATTANCQEYRQVSKINRLVQVFVVRPEWVLRCEEEGRKVPINDYRLPPLTGFVICATNLKKDEREEIITLAQEGGADYRGNMSSACTHLIAQKPAGRKWEFANESNTIHIVRSEWISACVSQNKLLDENDFQLLLDKDGNSLSLPGRGNDTMTVSKTMCPNLSVPESNSLDMGYSLTEAVPSLLLDCCCFFPIPSIDVEKSKSAQKQIFTLGAIGGATVLSRLSNLVTHAVITGVPLARADVFMLRKAELSGVRIVAIEWIQLSLRSNTILSIDACPIPAWDTGEPHPSMLSSAKEPVSAFTSSVFQGVRAALVPLSLRDAEIAGDIGAVIKSGRGIVLPTGVDGKVHSGVPTHAVCPDGLGVSESKALLELRSSGDAIEAVTHEWIRVCLDEKCLVPVSSCILFAPLPYTLPLGDFVKEGVSLTISGFQLNNDVSDRNRWRVNLGRLATLLGAEHSERMSRRCTTHLIASRESCNGQKYLRAKDWGIPVVSEEWLLSCAKVGVLLPVDSYSVKPYSPGSASIIQNGLANSSPVAKYHELASGSMNRREGEFARPAPRKRTRSLGSDGLMRNKRAKTEVGKDPENEKLMQTFAAGLNEISRQEKEAKEIQSIGNDKDMSWSVGDVTLVDDTSPLQLLDGEQDWSLEGSQSQVIVHKDLTPPQLSNFAKKKRAKRKLPNRAAKSKKNKGKNNS